jgi:hypothetical protein
MSTDGHSEEQHGEYAEITSFIDENDEEGIDADPEDAVLCSCQGPHG